MNKLLLIEDDDIAYMEISALLNGIGYDKRNLVRCASMQEVMDLDAKDIQLVLTDLSLPDSDYGDTFYKVQNKFNYIPIIVLTGIAEIDFAIKTIQNGAQDYLVKGDFDRKMLVKAIHYAIERKKIANDYTRVFNESPVPMYVFDAGTMKFLGINTAGLEQYGYTKDEFLALTAYDIRPKEDIEVFTRGIDNDTEIYLDMGQRRHVRKNGEIFFVQVNAHKTWFEGKQAWITSAINIDKKVAAENALIEKTKETENILESITDGLLKHSRGQLVGKMIWDIFPEAKNLKFHSEYHRAKKENVSVHFEERHPQLDLWLAVNAYPTPEGLTVYFVDVTEQRNHVNMIEEQNKRLKEIAWIQSHEVRGPVTSILGLINIFNTEDPSDPINKQILDNIKEATDKLDEITRRITNHTFISPDQDFQN